MTKRIKNMNFYMSEWSGKTFSIPPYMCCDFDATKRSDKIRLPFIEYTPKKDMVLKPEKTGVLQSKAAWDTPVQTILQKASVKIKLLDKASDYLSVQIPDIVSFLSKPAFGEKELKVLRRFQQLQKPLVSRMEGVKFACGGADELSRATEGFNAVFMVPYMLGKKIPYPRMGRLRDGGFAFELVDNGKIFIVWSYASDKPFTLFYGDGPDALREESVDYAHSLFDKLLALFSGEKTNDQTYCQLP